jgi:hypothetical protein
VKLRETIARNLGLGEPNVTKRVVSAIYESLPDSDLQNKETKLIRSRTGGQNST